MFVITEKAPTRALCWLKAPTSAFTFKTLGAFNQEKALVGVFSVIVKTDCETDGELHSTSNDIVLKYQD